MMSSVRCAPLRRAAWVGGAQHAARLATPPACTTAAAPALVRGLHSTRVAAMAEDKEKEGYMKGMRRSLADLNEYTASSDEGFVRRLRGGVAHARANRDQEKGEAVFRAQVKSLLAIEGRFDLNHFHEQIDEALREHMGVGPIKEQMPWVKNNPAYLEMKEDIDVLQALTQAERDDPQLIGPEQRQRVVADLEVEPTTVARVLKNFENSRSLHGWLHRRRSAGQPSPESPVEAQRFIREEGESAAPSQRNKFVSAAKRKQRRRSRR